MRKKVIYLGIGVIILGIILVLMGIFVMSDSGFFVLSRDYETLSNILLLRSIMNWLGIILSISGAVTFIVGIYLDEPSQIFKPEVNLIKQQKEDYHPIEKESGQPINKIGFCFQCGAELGAASKYCYECGTKLR